MAAYLRSVTFYTSANPVGETDLHNATAGIAPPLGKESGQSQFATNRKPREQEIAVFFFGIDAVAIALHTSANY